MTVLRVIEPFACDIDGVPRVYRAGDLVQSTDKVTKGRERFFTDAEEYVARTSPSVEAATAVPGERRSLVGGARKTARKRASASGADDGQADPGKGAPKEGVKTDPGGGAPKDGVKTDKSGKD